MDKSGELTPELYGGTIIHYTEVTEVQKTLNVVARVNNGTEPLVREEEGNSLRERLLPFRNSSFRNSRNERLSYSEIGELMTIIDKYGTTITQSLSFGNVTGNEDKEEQKKGFFNNIIVLGVRSKKKTIIETEEEQVQVEEKYTYTPSYSNKDATRHYISPRLKTVYGEPSTTIVSVNPVKVDEPVAVFSFVPLNKDVFVAEEKASSDFYQELPEYGYASAPGLPFGIMK